MVINMISDVKKRLFKALTVAGALVLILAGYALFVNIAGFGLPCVFNKMYGIKCAGCGMSRAAAALLRFDIKTAFSYNLAWPLFLIYGIWSGIYIFIRYVVHGESPSLARPLWLNYTMLITIFIYGIVRNFI